MVWIAAAARQTGASVKAIRLYESMGLIAPARHQGYRYFDALTLETLRCIKTAQSLGFSLKELQALKRADGGWHVQIFEQAIQSRRAALQHHIAALEQQSSQLQQLAADVHQPLFCSSLKTA
jgi:MerR family transcriptional regulator, copper efflux regulator